MWSLRTSRPRDPDLERSLRELRAEPRAEFMESLARRLQRERLPVARPWSRLAFAAAASTLLLGMFASFGGAGYTATASTSAYKAVKQIVAKHKVTVTVDRSSASAQYPGNPSPPANSTAAGHANRHSRVASATLQAAVESKSLPLTGFSLVGTVLISSALLVLGLLLRRRERSKT
jgi:hypothetical protein